MDHSGNDQHSFDDWTQLDQNEPSWQSALIGFVVIFLSVGLFFLLWVGLFRYSSP
jgi:hypothetical protein